MSGSTEACNEVMGLKREHSEQPAGLGIVCLILVGVEVTVMAQRKPKEKTTLDQVLKLAHQLTPEEQEQLVEQMKLQWLRRALEEGEESLKLHGGIPAEEVLAELKQRAEDRLRKSRQ